MHKIQHRQPSGRNHPKWLGDPNPLYSSVHILYSKRVTLYRQTLVRRMWQLIQSERHSWITNQTRLPYLSNQQGAGIIIPGFLGCYPLKLHSLTVRQQNKTSRNSVRAITRSLQLSQEWDPNTGSVTTAGVLARKSNTDILSSPLCILDNERSCPGNMVVSNGSKWSTWCLVTISSQ